MIDWLKRNLFNKRVNQVVKVDKKNEFSITTKFLDRVKLHEGFRSEPYRDSLGFLTIGYGRLLDGKGITKKEGEYLLMNDLNQAIEDAKSLFGNFDDLSQKRQEVLVEMCFQLGKGGVSKFVNFRKAVANGHFVEAAAEMKNSLWAKQTPNRVNKLTKAMKGEETNIVV